MSTGKPNKDDLAIAEHEYNSSSCTQCMTLVSDYETTSTHISPVQGAVMSRTREMTANERELHRLSPTDMDTSYPLQTQ